MILVDTSVWIEYLQRRSPRDFSVLDSLIRDKQVATCWPIRAELLSGYFSSSKRNEAEWALAAMIPIDPAWNSSDVWKGVIDLAAFCHRRGIRIPGLVDRMILVAVQKSSATLWTFDQALRQLASLLEISTFLEEK